MKFEINKSLKALFVVAAFSITIVSCNKALPDAEPINQPAPTGSSINSLLSDPNFSILKAAVTRAGTSLTKLLSDSTAVFTFFAPDNAAFNLSGIPSEAAIGAFRAGQLDTLLRYHLIGGVKIKAADISEAVPNMYLQSSFVLAPPSASLPPGLRMPIFPSRRGTVAWVNNIPVTQADITASNGVIHKVATLVAPPSQVLLQRIATDPDLTYLYAAVQRADSGDAAQTLQAALQNPAANLTVFAPSNAAFKAVLTGQITLALVGMGYDLTTAQATATLLASSPTVFTNPALASVLTPTVVKGIVVYHLLGIRAFSVNIPVTPTALHTLLNSAIPAHPGVVVQATFGLTGVTSATVKGLGNASASNIAINPTPAPGGTSDQHYINGTLHKIDQVLLPQ
ncbi:MAG: fasciclin domain-containing protein [Bacteroidetes bacterium]|nr:fasciclin domain-containing protein [Bacteroidota bacterium]